MLIGSYAPPSNGAAMHSSRNIGGMKAKQFNTHQRYQAPMNILDSHRVTINQSMHSYKTGASTSRKRVVLRE